MEYDDIECLDDVDTETIQKKHWHLDRIFTGHIEKTMLTYEEAITYAENQLSLHKVALRTVVVGNIVLWEIYVR